MGHATEETGAHAVERPECPRCGYDQSGEVATWRQACPLHGRCSECGLEVEWREIVSPRFAAPRWFAESAHCGWWSFVVTPVRTLLPRWFWRSVRLPMRVALLRAMSSAAVGACLAMCAVAGASAVIRFAANQQKPRALREQVLYWEDLIPPARYGLIFEGWWWEQWPMPGWVEPAIMAALPVLFLAAFLLLPVTMRRLRVLRRHLLRIMLQGLPGFVLAMSAPALMDTVEEVAAGYIVWGSHAGAVRPVFGGLLEPVCDWWLGVYDWPWPALLGFAWLAWWWWSASSRYLRLPRAGMTTMVLALVVAVSLAVGAVWASVIGLG